MDRYDRYICMNFVEEKRINQSGKRQVMGQVWEGKKQLRRYIVL